MKKKKRNVVRRSYRKRDMLVGNLTASFVIWNPMACECRCGSYTNEGACRYISENAGEFDRTLMIAEAKDRLAVFSALRRNPWDELAGRALQRINKKDGLT